MIKFDKGHSAACVYGDIAIGKDTIRVYSVHLESYRLGKNEQQIYKELTSATRKTPRKVSRLYLLVWLPPTETGQNRRK